ncbi:MAG: outer membrane beta-barrel protein [Pseudomonadota bacterium]
MFTTKRHIFLLLLFMSLQAGQLAAAAEYELIPFAGYRFGGSLDEEESGNSVDLEEGGSWGFIIGSEASNTTRYELLYSRQNSGLTETTDPNNAFGLAIHYLHLGGTADVYQEEFTSFVSGGLGLTHMNPDSDGLVNETFFSLSLGGGLKWYPTERLGVRLELRGYGTLTSGESSLFCGEGSCNFRISGDLIPQFETNLGLIFRF